MSVFGGAKIAGQKKSKIILRDSLVPVLVIELSVELFAGVVKLLNIAEAISIGFGFCKFYLFFSDVGDSILVHIGT
ncbi:hypothetical protein G9A89_021078 [Geosiphon pyriformis]|nr:hypothetical protein G9A89_021078 [Geosiphon pyriformis]